MAEVKITYDSPKNTVVSGWAYLWAKTVLGFDPTKHCAKCLRGEYVADVGTKMDIGTPARVEVPEGTVIYLCGVAKPYRWANNLHAPMIAAEGERFTVRAYNGDWIDVENARRLDIDPKPARETYPDLTSAFLTCRNFQFAAAWFGTETPG